MIRSVKRALLCFELKIRRREIFSSHEIAIETVNLVKATIQPSNSQFEVEQAINIVTSQLCEHFPRNVIITNACDNIISKFKEEIRSSASSSKEKVLIPRSKSKSFIDMLAVPTIDLTNTPNSDTTTFKFRMIEILDGLITDLAQSYEEIAKNAPNFIFSHDIILTVGLSQSIEKFLSTCSKSIGTVVIPERAPEYDGIIMAQRLRKAKINCLVIPDSCVFAMLPRINKIIVPARAVLANGGIVSYSLTHSIALAAKHHATPFIALYWEMKLSKEMPSPGKLFTNLLQPSPVLSKGDPIMSSVVGLNTEGDYIPPELITLMINETGSHCPADVFSIVQANYFD